MQLNTPSLKAELEALTKEYQDALEGLDCPVKVALTIGRGSSKAVRGFAEQYGLARRHFNCLNERIHDLEYRTSNMHGAGARLTRCQHLSAAILQTTQHLEELEMAHLLEMPLDGVLQNLQGLLALSSLQERLH